jgi:hypothetical protein
LDAALVEVSDHPRQVLGERPAPNIHDNRQLGDSPLAAAAQVDHGGDEFGRKIVDDEKT